MYRLFRTFILLVHALNDNCIRYCSFVDHFTSIFLLCLLYLTFCKSVISFENIL